MAGIRKCTFTVPDSETLGEHGQLVAISKKHAFDNIDNDTLIEIIEEFESSGFAVDVALKIKPLSD